MLGTFWLDEGGVCLLFQPSATMVCSYRGVLRRACHLDGSDCQGQWYDSSKCIRRRSRMHFCLSQELGIVTHPGG